MGAGSGERLQKEGELKFKCLCSSTATSSIRLAQGSHTFEDDRICRTEKHLANGHISIAHTMKAEYQPIPGSELGGSHVDRPKVRVIPWLLHGVFLSISMSFLICGLWLYNNSRTIGQGDGSPIYCSIYELLKYLLLVLMFLTSSCVGRSSI